MSQTNYDTDVISWSIDREPEFNILHYLADYPITDEFSIVEDNNSIEYRDNQRIFLEQFNTITNMIYRGETVFNTEDDFIPFDEVDMLNNVDMHYIIEPFALTEHEKTCCVCMEERKNEQICRLNCQHTFCVYCVNQHLHQKDCCPLCRTHITTIQTQTVESKKQINH